MGGTKAQLQAMLNTAVTVFNPPDSNYDAAGTLLAPEIVLISVRQQKQIQGKDKVIDFMKTQIDKPSFTPTSVPTFNLDGADGVATTATITGTGTWKDANGTEQLNFTFKCKFTNNSWLFTDLRTIRLA
jgi:hypothetical protein